MTLQELAKEIQNALAAPYAWEKVGLGDLPVEKVQQYVQDRANNMALWVFEQMEEEIKRQVRAEVKNLMFAERYGNKGGK